MQQITLNITNSIKENLLRISVQQNKSIDKTVEEIFLDYFSKNNKSHSPNGQVIDDLYSPNAFNTHIGKQVSANLQHCE